MKHPVIFSALALLAACILASAPLPASAAYPAKSIQVIAPANPGGDTDANARLYGRYLEKELGKPVVIVNVGSGGGIAGMQRVLSAKPDGYTVLFFHTEGLIPKIGGFINFDLLDFDICGMALLDDTTVLAVDKKAPYQTLPALVEYARANPGKVEFAMQTAGYAHIIGIGLEEAAKADFKMVDVGGNAAKLVALKGKKTDVISIQYALIRDYITAGEFTCLGLFSRMRNGLIPDVPTTKELGYPLEFNKFFIFAMPKGTPRPVIDAFSAALKKVVANKELQAEAKKMLLTPYYLPPAEARKHVEDVRAYLMQFQAKLQAQSTKK